MYTNILVAIDLTETASRHVISAAQAFFEKSAGADANLSVVHVVEPQYVQYSFDPTFSGSMTRSLEHNALEGAANRVAHLCKPFGIPREAQHVILGRVANRIHAFARDQNIDLIVIGSHGHHGLRRALGSTANAVLHGAPVNVIVARLPQNDH